MVSRSYEEQLIPGHLQAKSNVVGKICISNIQTADLSHLQRLGQKFQIWIVGKL